MQITNELKERPENAKTEDERNEILSSAIESAKQAGIELDDSELDQAAGGRNYGYQNIIYVCDSCGRSYDEGGNCACGAPLTPQRSR